MLNYSDQGSKPLSLTDWEKVKALKYPSRWKGMVSAFLNEVQGTSSIPERREFVRDNRLYYAYHVSRVINLCFREYDLSYRCFKTEYNGDTYIIGIVEPIKRKTRRLTKAAKNSMAMIDVIKAARILARKPTPKNITELRKVLKNPNLPR